MYSQLLTVVLFCLKALLSHCFHAYSCQLNLVFSNSTKHLLSETALGNHFQSKILQQCYHSQQTIRNVEKLQSYNIDNTDEDDTTTTNLMTKKLSLFIQKLGSFQITFVLILDSFEDAVWLWHRHFPHPNWKLRKINVGILEPSIQLGFGPVSRPACFLRPFLQKHWGILLLLPRNQRSPSHNSIFDSAIPIHIFFHPSNILWIKPERVREPGPILHCGPPGLPIWSE